ncbi:MAG: hypothetical protein QM783_05825 [Phycisphaerales bacterium]
MMRVHSFVGAVAVSCTGIGAFAQSAGPAGSAAASKDVGADPTEQYRKPASCIERCGPLTFQDIGLWPDMQAQMEGKGPLYVTRPLNHAVNSRGQTLVVTEPVPPDGITRNAVSGLVQYVINGRPSSGVLNERGDVFGQIIVDNPEPEKPDDTHYQMYLKRAFLLPAGATQPVFIDVPPGEYIQAASIDENGVGLGLIIKGRSYANELAIKPVRVALNASGKATWTPLAEAPALPKGVTSCVPAGIDRLGNVLVGMQTPTGELSSVMIKLDNGEWARTCPNFVQAVSCGGLLKDGKAQVLPIPKGYTELSPVTILDDGTVLATGVRWVGEAQFSDPVVCRQDKHRLFDGFPDGSSACITDGAGTLACGIATLPDSVSAALPKDTTEAQKETFYSLRVCGVIWDVPTGRFVTLDSLLPRGSSCTHIDSALAIHGNKVLCTGTIGGKKHAIVVTLPADIHKGFAQTQ